MNENDYFRTRINTKQTAKGEWYIDFTTEIKQATVDKPGHNDIVATIHMKYLESIEKAMRVAGKKLVGE